MRTLIILIALAALLGCAGGNQQQGMPELGEPRLEKVERPGAGGVFRDKIEDWQRREAEARKKAGQQ